MNKVINVSPLPRGFLSVVLADGRVGEFDVKPYMKSPFFAQLKEETYFNKVQLFSPGLVGRKGRI